MKKCLTVLLVLALLLSGCGSDSAAVAVQRADQLALAGRAGERYAGVVVSENVVEITRDSSKRVEELYVEVGQEVTAGDKLFSYDTDELELALEKAQLEVEKMTNELADYRQQQEKLEKKLGKTYNESDKVRLTLEINTLKTTIMEHEYTLKSKDKEIARLQEMLQNVDIVAPVDGTIRKVDEDGQTQSYITIQQSGAYRVQGMLNEMSMGGGIMPGSRVEVHSRVSDQVWMGTVTAINTADSQQNNNDMYYGNYGIVDTMTQSSSYVFDVELDSVEGLLLGQHVYIELFVEAPAMEGLWIPESFLAEMGMNEETFEMTAKVWAENNGRLELRSVALGMYDPMTGCYEILSGITAEDYLADPANPACEAGAAVSRREPKDFGTTEADMEAIPEETADESGIMLPIETAPEGAEG